MKLVNQINDKSCVHACLSMVTGIPVEKLWERFPRPMWQEDEIVVLVENKIFPVPAAAYGPQFLRYGTYMMSVPSLNVEGALHCVLVVYNEEGAFLYDPQSGREGKKYYPLRSLMSDYDGPIKVSGYAQVTFLDFEMLKGMFL